MSFLSRSKRIRENNFDYFTLQIKYPKFFRDFTNKISKNFKNFTNKISKNFLKTL